CWIDGNTATGGPNFGGGGITNNSGSLQVINSTISDNHAGIGGGIFSVAPLTVVNRTIWNNTSPHMGGGIAAFGSSASGSSAQLSGVTIVGNEANSDSGSGASGGGGGIVIASTVPVTLTNCLVALNSRLPLTGLSTTRDDIVGAVVST